MSMSPTQRSLQKLRSEGYQAEVVEHTIPKTYIKKDLFGFIDIIAVGHGQTLAVQTTDGTSVSKRIKKIQASDLLSGCLTAGWRIVVHGWAKRGARGQPKRWTCREVEIGLQAGSTADS